MNRITIFHYHLLPGGVTNVIQLGAIALLRHYPDLQLLRLVCGKAENTETIRSRIEKEIDATGLIGDSFRFEICVEPSINYADAGDDTDSAAEGLASHLLEKYGDSFWWVHNYQLGKNPLVTAAVTFISNNRPEQKMLLHIHDFPECARFDNLEKLYSAGVRNPYPAGRGTAYALINGRDAALLKKAGIPEDRVFLLNNPVEDESTSLPPLPSEEAAKLKDAYYSLYRNDFPRVDPDAKMVFYPVRTIRRKNALEAGLIAAVSNQPVNLILSLPGVSGQESKYSEACEKCFRTGMIPGIWGSGTSDSKEVPSYPQMLQLCEMILSSSVQEGFGYLFINSVQLGIPLIARDLDILDGIRSCFPDEHVKFYNSFKIPSDCTDAEQILKGYMRKLDNLQKYISDGASEKIRLQISSLAADGTVDFSYLPVEKQIEILSAVRSSVDLRNEIHAINNPLMNEVYSKLDSGRYTPDTQIEAFSLKSHSGTFESIVKMLYEDRDIEIIDSDVQQNLIDFFAEPDYIRLLYDY